MKRTGKPNPDDSDLTLAEKLVLKKDLLKRASRTLNIKYEDLVNASQEIDKRIKLHYKEDDYGGLLYSKTKHGHEQRESYPLMRKITVDTLKSLGYGEQTNDPKFWLEIAAKKLNLDEDTKKYAERKIQEINKGSPSVKTATAIYLAKKDRGLRSPTQYEIAKAIYINEISIIRLLRILKHPK